MDIIFVRAARKGLKVPLDRNEGGYYPDDETLPPARVEKSLYIVRRLRDGSLVEVQAEPKPKGMPATAGSVGGDEARLTRTATQPKTHIP